MRLRQQANMLATLLFSQGTPMIVAGDEFGRTQHGNNNAYAQDNEISWIDWEGIGEEGRALAQFVVELVRLRRQKPLLRRGRFLSGAYNEELEVKDVTWLTASGTEMTPENWEDANARSLGVLLDGRAQETGIRRRGTDVTLYLVLNAHTDVVKFTLPRTLGGRGWILRIDTNQLDGNDGKTFRFDDQYEVTGRSLLLFELRRSGRSGRNEPAGASRVA
jgi:glycogen operon protein